MQQQLVYWASKQFQLVIAYERGKGDSFCIYENLMQTIHHANQEEYIELHKCMIRSFEHLINWLDFFSSIFSSFFKQFLSHFLTIFLQFFSSVFSSFFN